MFYPSEKTTNLLDTQFNTGTRFGNIMLRGIEQWIELNLQLAQQQIDSNLSTINKLADTHHHVSSVTEEKIAAASGAMNYPITVYEIMLKAQTEIAKLIGEHFEELSQQATQIFHTVQPQKNGANQIVINSSGENRSKPAAIKTAGTTHRKNEARTVDH